MHNHEILYIEATLGISRGELATIVGCSYSSLQRLSSGSRTAKVLGKEPEIIQILLRMTKAVAHLYGKDSAMAKLWLRINAPDTPPPIEQLTSLEKLICITLDLENQMALGGTKGAPDAH